MTKQQIGRLVKEARIAQGLSYRQLAELTSLSTRSLQQIEKASTNYGVDLLATVCKALRLTIAVSLQGVKKGG